MVAGCGNNERTMACGCGPLPDKAPAATLREAVAAVFRTSYRPRRRIDAGPINPAELRQLVSEAVRALADLGVSRNADEEGRARARERFGDSTVGICGHLGRGILESLGIHGCVARHYGLVSANKPLRFNGLPDLSDFYNLDHAAACVLTSEGPRFVEPWLHATTSGSLEAYGDSRHALMTPKEWYGAMRKRGYCFFRLKRDGEAVEVNTSDDLACAFEGC